jgi:hypothetical protein
MAASVQGWRTKWFYIKDRKNSSSDKYGLAPFETSQELKKLASWDSPPTEAEMEEIKPLLAHIQELKSGKGGALSGTQLMAFFLATSGSTAATLSFQVVDFFWLGGSFSSI